MKLITLILLTFYLNLFCFSQESSIDFQIIDISEKIKEIEIKESLKDTSIKVFCYKNDGTGLQPIIDKNFGFTKIPIQFNISVKTESEYMRERQEFDQSIIVFKRNDSIVKIRIPDKSGRGITLPSEFYFEKNKLIFAKENFWEMSRMGSCGEMLVENKYYVFENKLFLQITKEQEFNCYQNTFDFENLIKSLNNYLNLLNFNQLEVKL